MIKLAKYLDQTQFNFAPFFFFFLKIN